MIIILSQTKKMFRCFDTKLSLQHTAHICTKVISSIPLLSVKIIILVSLLLILDLFSTIHYIKAAASSCNNNPSFRYNGVKYKTCDWVAQSKYSRCKLKTKKKNGGVVKVRDECKRTCQSCSIYRNKQVGKFCVGGWNCSSRVCTNGTCYASSKCKPIKQKFGQTFHTNRAILVFVGSDFKNLNQWHVQISNTYSAIEKYNFFAKSNDQFIALYVDRLKPSFCNYFCAGIERLLCCDTTTAKSLRDECFPTPNSGAKNIQTIVIHNNEKYGGAGYRSDNMATTSIHSDGPKVAVHELGHSMFELGDEYREGRGDNLNSPNCDVKGCSKWRDLVKRKAASCIPGFCNGGMYYVGKDDSFMGSFGYGTGNVNLRFSCCSYYVITKRFPKYCNKTFFGGAAALLHYCKKDYQFYGSSAYDKSYESLSISQRSNSSEGKLIYIKRPMHISIDVDTADYRISTLPSSSPGLFDKSQVYGDFSRLESAYEANLRKVIMVTIQFGNDDNSKMVLFYSPIRMVIPPPLSNNNSSALVQYEEHDGKTDELMMIDGLVKDDWYIKSFTLDNNNVMISTRVRHIEIVIDNALHKEPVTNVMSEYVAVHTSN